MHATDTRQSLAYVVDAVHHFLGRPCGFSVSRLWSRWQLKTTVGRRRRAVWHIITQPVRKEVSHTTSGSLLLGENRPERHQ